MRHDLTGTFVAAGNVAAAPAFGVRTPIRSGVFFIRAGAAKLEANRQASAAATPATNLRREMRMDGTSDIPVFF